MSKGFGHNHSLKTSNTLRIDPKVILTSQVLEMTQGELEQALEIELNENPALERIDEGEIPLHDDDILKSLAPHELKPGGECRELHRSLPQDGSDTDWLDLASSGEDLWDHLRGQLLTKVPKQLYQLLEYIVGSVNERGYLTCTAEEAALDCDVLYDDALWIIEKLKECDPAGVGAADLRECLLLQVKDAQTEPERLARAILKTEWENLVQRDTRAIRRRYRCDSELVEEALEVIVSLNPFPGETFSFSGHTNSVGGRTAYPDLIISRNENGYQIEVPGPSSSNLRVSRVYYSQIQQEKKSRGLERSENRHLTEYVHRAQRFMDALSSRTRLMIEIGQYLIEKQHGFIATGEYRFLNSLTRSKMATELDAHESTVSRATSGKFIQIPSGEVISFDVFFKPSLRIQKLIEEILATENPGNPLSDEAITRLLERQGVKVARRTVNKYRDRTKLLSSRRRRSA